MAEKIIPPVSITELQDDIKDPTWSVYIVIGQQTDKAWETAVSICSLFARTHYYLVKDSVGVAQWLSESGVSGWPEGTPWNNNTPVAITFGYQNTPVFYLNQTQAEGCFAVRDAHRRACELTES